MVEFSYRTRKDDIKNLNGRHVTCLIIGGGIVGAGLANLLSHNKVETVLVEKGDFASGTSSGSSKLIHGGIRYLAQGHVKLTRDLLRERNYLIENTDIVKRLDFDILIDNYSWSPSYMRLGLFLYSLLGGKPEIPRMKRNNGEYERSVKGFFHYYDGVTDDSRLVIYNIVSAHDRGAYCLNYTEAVSFSDRKDGVEVTLRDNTGGREFSITADVVVNCTGPWINKVLSLYKPEINIPLKLSKGVHLVFDKKDVPAERAITFRSHIDRRQMFVIPRDSVAIIGTTESLVRGPSDLSVENDDVDYIVNSVKRLFPNLSRNNVLAKYSGIRPLLGRGDNPDRISRDFSIFTHGRMISVAGVKLTDFRHASRKIAREVGKFCGIRIRTSNLPVMDYRRPESGNPFRECIINECALFPEDILRRRDGTTIYDPLNLGSVEKVVKDAFRSTGAVGVTWAETES